MPLGQIFGLHPAIFIVLLVWSMIWKGIALWHSGRNNQLGWFVVLFVINTVGILEIVYLAFFQKPQREASVGEAVEKKTEKVEKKSARKKNRAKR